jgi:hypothetical protein
VQRVDVFALDSGEYPDAMDFHRKIAPEISRLDKAIREKFNGKLVSDKVH